MRRWLFRASRDMEAAVTAFERWSGTVEPWSARPSAAAASAASRTVRPKWYCGNARQMSSLWGGREGPANVDLKG